MIDPDCVVAIWRASESRGQVTFRSGSSLLVALVSCATRPSPKSGEGRFRGDRVVVIVGDHMTADDDCSKSPRGVLSAAGDAGAVASGRVVLATADAWRQRLDESAGGGAVAAGGVVQAACNTGAFADGYVVLTTADAWRLHRDERAGGGVVEAAANARTCAAGGVVLATADAGEWEVGGVVETAANACGNGAGDVAIALARGIALATADAGVEAAGDIVKTAAHAGPQITNCVQLACEEAAERGHGEPMTTPDYQVM